MHAMTWSNPDTGLEVSQGTTDPYITSDIVDTYAQRFSDQNITEFLVDCQHVELRAWIAYNRTTYDNCSHAWDNDALTVLWGIEWDEIGTGLNAWNLVTALLFFQLPPGVPHPLNFIIALPIWIIEAVLIAQLVLAFISVLPFT